MIKSKPKLLCLLALVFAANYLETWIETWLKDQHQVGTRLALGFTSAVQSFEGNHSFENHDLTNLLAVYGYSISYYFLFPALALIVLYLLAARPTMSPLRVLSFAVLIDYLISLPFFLFFPVMERWTNADSGAMLLSDRWSSKLIESFRPLSGLDNCFPSSHVSITVILIMVCYLFQVRIRTPILALGLTIILSTLVLGIHWLPDVIAGAAVGFLSVAVAVKLDKMPAKDAMRPSFS
jgi:membrane-associated phospholipid phosphatase